MSIVAGSPVNKCDDLLIRQFSFPDHFLHLKKFKAGCFLGHVAIHDCHDDKKMFDLGTKAYYEIVHAKLNTTSAIEMCEIFYL